MNILIDSDILIEVFRARNEDIIARWRLLQSPDDVLMCSPVSVCELWHGARSKEHAALNLLFASLLCLPITAAVGRRAGDYMQKYSASHSVEIADALIAATAAVHEAALWTRNRKHYPMRDLNLY